MSQSSIAETAPPNAAAPASLSGRVAAFAYGFTVYVLFLATFTYLIGFVSGAIVPKHVDSGTVGPVGLTIAIDAALLALFAVQHAVMARPWFKRWITRFLPRAVERSTFVLATCLVMGTMVLFWRPLPEIVWQVEGIGAAALHGFAAFGWMTVLVSTFLIDHFELFGLRQAWNTLRGRPLDPPTFRERLLYRVVRHPLMVGFLIAFWSTPVMTAGHFLFAGLATAYIFVGTAIEERDLVTAHGDAYRDYRRRVPAFLPMLRRAS